MVVNSARDRIWCIRYHGTGIDCFKEALPYFFGSDVGETHFTAITDNEDGKNGVSNPFILIGGDTTNSLLMD